MGMITGPVMVAIMAIDPVLTLAQWFSPAYPVGAFAYSHGLEQAIADGDVTDTASLQAWIKAVLHHGAGRNDALFLAASYHGPDPAVIDAHLRAFASSKERLMEADLLGRAFAQITASLTGHDLSHLTYPVAVGRAAALVDLPIELTTAMFLQAFVSSLVSVGQRLIPIGQTDGQTIIAALAADCQQIARDTEGGDLSDLSSTAFLSDIAAMRHETLTSRVFRT
ncbi:urease accessory protein UreF [Pseudooctadecabacter sp.]|uniref:urease accessory protein UreF n=1 Tax=Pseudooctadecabacter sp. TaxID=1966338 RepID=UPI0035C7FDA5